MIHRRVFGLVCCLLLAGSPRPSAADNGTGRRDPVPSQWSGPYTSIYDDVRATGRDAAPQTRIHRILARRLDRIAALEVVKAWVLFKDKGIDSLRAYEGAIQNLQTTYNRRATERRLKRRSWPGLFDEHDLPVATAYAAQVEATGARVHITSRWTNGVSVEATAAQFEQIDRLEFVRIIQPVRRSRGIEPIVEADIGDTPGGLEPAARLRDRLSTGAPGSTVSPEAFYGNAGAQLTQINLPGVHDLGFTGKHVIIGVLDTGFRISHVAFNDPAHPLNVVAQWDFVNDDPNPGYDVGDPGGQYSHGTYILGTLGAYKPDSLVGGAYDASFILCKTEDTSAEYQGEEDNYVAGLEFVEANGGDMATSSLAYLGFDNPGDSYTQEDLNGLIAITTVGVNVATANGLHCCTAAGNAGHDPYPSNSHLLAPADAFDAITVGAVNSSGIIASFSSDGPTADGRVKPEVLARGVSTWTVSPSYDSEYITVGGTSLSTPLAAGVVACLIDAYPNWSVQKMREALFETASHYVATGTFDPTYVEGYGIIDALGALRADCNDNDQDDQEEIAGGSSRDCNENGIPDECERDCNGNGLPDECEFYSGFVARSPQLSPFYYQTGPIPTYMINSPPEATGDVTLSFTASADLESTSEYVIVTLNNNVIPDGDIFVLDAGTCADPPDEAQIVLAAEDYNTIVDGGALVIAMYPSPDVGAAPCGSYSYIAVTVEYEAVPFAQDCNGNLVPDSCDQAGDLDGDGYLSLTDHAIAVDCVSSPCLDPPCDPALYVDPCCLITDFDLDGDFDLKDFASIQLEIVGR